MAGDHHCDDVPDTEMSVHNFSGECNSDDSDDENGLTDYNEEKVRQEFARLFCTDDLPLHFINDHAFQNFLHTLNPLIQFPTVESLEGDCLEFYKKEGVKIRHVLGNLVGQISLSVEILRSPANYRYLCLTAHFIDENWKLKKWILRFHCLWNLVLPEAIKKALSCWGIENKVSTITLKSYNDKTVDMVKDLIQEKKQLQLNGQLFHVYCCADLITLMVQDAFGEISEIIDKVSELISWGVSSSLWDVTTTRLKEALELQSAGEFSSQRNVPSVDEWKKVEGICKLVDKIHDIAKLLFETKYPTASIVLSNLRELQVSLIQEASNSDGFISSLVEKMLQKLNKYWKDMFLVLAVATVMDPRCKMKCIEYLSLELKDGDCNSQVSTVLEAIHSIYDDYTTLMIEKEDSECDSASDCHSFYDDYATLIEEDYECDSSFDAEKEGPLTKKRKEEVPSRVEGGCSNADDVSSHIKGFHLFVQSTKGSPKSELDWYLEEPVLPWCQNFDILSWWRAASPKYPTLSRMARGLLGIPISVLTSSDAYYTEDRNVRLVSSRQAVINAVMCARSWH